MAVRRWPALIKPVWPHASLAEKSTILQPRTLAFQSSGSSAWSLAKAAFCASTLLAAAVNAFLAL